MTVSGGEVLSLGGDGVDATQLLARLVDSKEPLDAGALTVAGAFPGCELAAEDFTVPDPSFETLRLHDATAT